MVVKQREVHKFCLGCERIKSLEDFHKSSKGKMGRNERCKVCRSIIDKQKRSEDSRFKERSSRYRQSVKGKAQAKAYRTTNAEEMREYKRAWNLQVRFGMSIEDFDAILERQNFCCRICKVDTSGGRGTWHVDHCHKTGLVRGLLCSRCNQAMGWFEDNPKLLWKALIYLLSEGRRTSLPVERDGGSDRKVEKVTLKDIQAALVRTHKKKRVA